MSTIAPLQRASLDQPYTFLWTVTKLRVLAHHLLDRCREARLDPERSDAVEPCSSSFLAQSAAGPQADRAPTTALPIGVVLLKSSP